MCTTMRESFSLCQTPGPTVTKFYGYDDNGALQYVLSEGCVRDCSSASVIYSAFESGHDISWNFFFDELRS